MSTTEIKPNPESPAEEIARMREQNHLKLRSLDQRGMLPPDSFMLMTKLDLLIDFAVGGPARIMFDHLLEELVASRLDEWESFATRSQLTSGIEVTPNV